MIPVAVAVFIMNNRVLMCQRKKSSRYPLKWEFPGGKVEQGESIEQGLRRELREELSIDAGPVEYTETEVSHYDDGSVYEVNYCFLGSFSGTMKNNVFEDVRWVTASELPTYDILQGNIGFVERLRSNGFGKRP